MGRFIFGIVCLPVAVALCVKAMFIDPLLWADNDIEGGPGWSRK